MLNISLRQLRYITALADTGSFSKAAAQAGVTQPTLSAAIQELELTLKVRIADRANSRRVTLTPVGEALAERARQVLELVEDMPGLAAQTLRPLTTRLRLGVIASVAPFLLPSALPALRRDFPELPIAVREALTATLLKDVRSGQIDAAVLALPLQADDLDAAPLWDDPLVVAVPRNHPLARRAAVTPNDIRHERLLLLEAGHCLREHITISTGEPREDDDDLRATSLITLVQMADNGLGITFLPQIAIDAGIARGADLSLLRYDSPHSFRTLALVWRKGSSRHRDYLLLAEHLKSMS
jgi:LysR family transcriptional regulator, hydrogen peroxide-inducible genes activator